MQENLVWWQEPSAGTLLLNEALVASLTADYPDMATLEHRIVEELALPPEDARCVIRGVVADFNARLFPQITHLELIHTEGCNLGCSYCFEKDMLGYRRMAPEVARAAVDLLFDYSGDARHLTILHFGGEPTMNFRGIRLATEHAEQRAAETGKTLEFDLTSNGVLLTDEMVDYFACHNIKVLLSVDGLEESHDRHRLDKRGRGTFRKVLDGMDKLRRRQRWIGVKMTVMPVSAVRLFDDVRGLYDLGVNQFIIGYATGIEWSKPDLETYTDQLGLVYAWYKEGKHDNLRITDFDAPAEGAFFGCQAGKNSVTVTVDGEVSPCSKILALDNRGILGKLGDVRYGLTHLKNRRDLVTCALLKENVCKSGLEAEFQGGCFASNYEANGNLFVPNLQDHMFSILQRSKCSGCKLS